LTNHFFNIAPTSLPEALLAIDSTSKYYAGHTSCFGEQKNKKSEKSAHLSPTTLSDATGQSQQVQLVRRRPTLLLSASDTTYVPLTTTRKENKKEKKKKKKKKSSKLTPELSSEQAANTASNSPTPLLVHSV
jgi:hypothetical protein